MKNSNQNTPPFIYNFSTKIQKIKEYSKSPKGRQILSNVNHFLLILIFYVILSHGVCKKLEDV